MSKQKLAVELGAFVKHPTEPAVLGRVMATWRDDKGVEMVKATWPSIRTESDHPAADLTAVEKPKPPEKPEPKAESEPKVEG